MDSFDKNNFLSLCDSLAERDKDLKNIIIQFGYPPLWSRTPSFATLIHIILEQQVSLASAKAAFLKLESAIGHITPEKILQLSDEEMKACYFSRQKIIYVKALANAIISKQINLKKLSVATDDEIRQTLKQIKGVGDWTVDVYLMHALQRSDLFPLGDIALVNSLKHVKQLHANITREEMLAIAENWRPYRTVASMLLWHAYIKRKGIKVLG